MIWTLLVFVFTMYVLSKVAFPRIQEALDKRANAIRESIEQAERTREEADKILHEYRQRLKEAREQADDIVARARRAAESTKAEAVDEGREKRDELREQLGQFADALSENRELQLFFFSPYFSSGEKKEGLERAISGAEPELVNFIELLLEKHRAPVLFRIRKQYDALWAKENK